MKPFLSLIFVISFFLLACKKVEIPEKVFIRIQNTSNIAYPAVSIDPTHRQQHHIVSDLQPGAVSEYKGFVFAKKEFDLSVKVSAYREESIYYPISKDAPSLSPGKYTLKIDCRMDDDRRNRYALFPTIVED